MPIAAALMVAAATLCPPLTPAALDGLQAERRIERVVFFASWCSNCKEHLIKAKDDTAAVFVAAFDERTAAEAVADRFGIPAGRCFVDDGVATRLGVKAVPAVVALP